MKDINLSAGIMVCAAWAALAVWGLVYLLGKSRPEKKLVGAYREIRGLLAAKQQDADWYGRCYRWLQKKGATSHFGTWMQPGAFLGLRIFLGTTGFLAGMAWSIGAGVLLAMILYGLPYVLVIYLNQRDNEKMLPEIKLIYHALEIQIRAGVYVADALTECYAGVQEKRLRQALLDLAGAIAMKADIYDALESFQEKFDNPYIDALCITILQTLESGQALELLGDIAEQVRDMEVSVLNRKKGALDRSVTFYQLGILAAMLGMVLYACVTQMFTAALQF